MTSSDYLFRTVRIRFILPYFSKNIQRASFTGDSGLRITELHKGHVFNKIPLTTKDAKILKLQVYQVQQVCRAAMGDEIY